MRYPLALLAALSIVLSLTSCGGGQDRSALAKQAVSTYWKDIDHGQIVTAYRMLTSGNRAVLAFGSYRQNMMGFLQSVSGLSVVPGSPTVSDDRAVVPVTMHSPRSPTPLRAFQHLFWENGSWKISDQNGGLSTSK